MGLNMGFAGERVGIECMSMGRVWDRDSLAVHAQTSDIVLKKNDVKKHFK